MTKSDMTPLEKFESEMALAFPNNVPTIGGIYILFANLQARKNLDHSFSPLDDAVTGPSLKTLIKSLAETGSHLTEEMLHPYFTPTTNYDPHGFEKFLKEYHVLPHAGILGGSEQHKEVEGVVHQTLTRTYENLLRGEAAFKQALDEQQSASQAASQEICNLQAQNTITMHELTQVQAQITEISSLREQLEATTKELKQVKTENTSLQNQLKEGKASQAAVAEAGKATPLETVAQLADTLPTVKPKSVPTQSAVRRAMETIITGAHVLYNSTEDFVEAVCGQSVAESIFGNHALVSAASPSSQPSDSSQSSAAASIAK